MENVNKEKIYVVAITHKNFECENTIIKANSAEEAFTILYDDSPGVIRDSRKIMFGLLDTIYSDESYGDYPIKSIKEGIKKAIDTIYTKGDLH